MKSTLVFVALLLTSAVALRAETSLECAAQAAKPVEVSDGGFQSKHAAEDAMDWAAGRLEHAGYVVVSKRVWQGAPDDWGYTIKYVAING